MPKKTEEETDTKPAGTRWEATVFLLDPQGAKTCIKGIGDAEVFEEIKAVAEHFYANGYKPDGFKNGYSNPAPSQAQPGQAQGGAPAEKPKSFKDANGTTWWINKSKFGDDFYIAHKNQDGSYSKLNWNEAPEYVRIAYGK